MNKLLIIFIIILSCSCTNNAKDKSFQVSKEKDSILLYYEKSIKKGISLKEKRQAINKVFKLADKNYNDTILKKNIYQKVFLHYSLQEYDSLIYFSNSIIKKSKHQNFEYNLGKLYYLKAYYFNHIEQNSDSAFVNYNYSKNQFQQINDSNWVAETILNMGLIQKNQGDFFGSKETITEAFHFLNKKKDSSLISSAYNALALNHRKLLNNKDAITYYLMAIEIAKYKKNVLTYKNNLGATYIDDRQYKKAIDLFSNIITDSLLLNTPTEYSRVLDNLAYAEWLSGENKNNVKLLDALYIRVKNNDTRGQIASYTHLGEFYSKNNPRKAISYLDSVIQLSKVLKNPRAEKDAIKHIMTIEPNNIKLKDRYVLLQDSLYNQELKVKTQFAKYKYDDKVTQETNLRLEKENTVQKLEAVQQRNQKIRSYAIGGMLLLLSGLVTLFFVQRSKRLKQQNRTAKLEATYETEAELSRKLHDDFGGRLNHAMILVQNDAKKSVLLDSLEGLYNQSRDFSREINEVETGVNFKNNLLEMLHSHTPKNTKLFILGSKEMEWSKMNELTKTTLHKVLRELMINMSKHSQATVVTLSFKEAFNRFKINYSDNGIGASEMEMNTKNGLRNTEKRIRAIGGTIIFETEKGKGFKVEIKTPN
ncbi:tetratricopeptide repeat-containing sensor histidine kinase [Cellulophaga baltica]|uniref:histidine kinase n=1 Tax=Cellulophaga baltica TaxID=76594 RepID=A0A1G7D632_9FLAO|nr:tetratricopeptide repeat-containing sensor histidine kinase [Cellulophaga baltica]SDE46460.1 hypothetical protein SAMN04487992_101349 [Cellulophaga baltica]